MWIELHQTLPRHPKLARLANRLRIPRTQAAGHLIFLWLWALDYCPTGNLSALEPAEISAAADFGGDAELFVQALKQVGWVDEDGMIHDWGDYAGRIVDERLQAKERMKAYRERQRTERQNKETVRDVTPNVRVTNSERAELPNTTQPNLTVPNQTNTPAPREGACARPANVEEVIALGAVCGVSEQDCRDWHRDMEACGWAKVDGTPFGNWKRELTIHRDRLRERQARQSGTAKPPTGERKEIAETIHIRKAVIGGNHGA